MKIVRAQHLGMCFGVRDAIKLAKAKAAHEPVTVLGELVHNEYVLADLRRHGVFVQQKLERVETRQALITAHGASEKLIARAKAQGLDVAEATCPLVHFAHRSVSDLVRDGYFPVIIGKRDHVEVLGITEDLKEYTVILDEEEVPQIPPREKIGVAAQTTQPIQRVQSLVQAIKKRFPDADVRFVDTVCQPTKNRQRAAIQLAENCDIVIVIGGANSNNTRELVTTCSSVCQRVYHVQTADDISSDWFLMEDVVGITAGTSTPDIIINAVEKRIKMIEGTLENAGCSREIEYANS
jgi:4-hydroxy-3-methylbut-2-enyl diphosphate reductase